MRLGLSVVVSPFYAVSDADEQGFSVWSFLDPCLSTPTMDAGEVHDGTGDFAHARRPALSLAVPLVCRMGFGAVRYDRIDCRLRSLS